MSILEFNYEEGYAVNEMSVMGIMKSIVPISRFNKGEANRIFDEVESGGTNVSREI